MTDKVRELVLQCIRESLNIKQQLLPTHDIKTDFGIVDELTIVRLFVKIDDWLNINITSDDDLINKTPLTVSDILKAVDEA